MAYQPTSEELRAVNFFLRQQFPNYNFDQLSSDQKLKLASGLVGNLRAESNLNPEAVNPESGAFGISQLLNVRKDNYDKFIEGMSDFDPFQTQLDFLRQELNPGSPYYDSLSGQRFGSIINQMNAGSLQTLPDITKALERAIFRSRPGGYEGEITPEQESIFNSSMAERIKFAQQLASLSPNFYGLKDQPKISKRRSLSGGLMDVFTNPARGMDRRMLTNDLMLILNSMSTRPDSGLAQSIGLEQQQLAEARASKGAFGGLTKEQFGIANTLRDDMRTDLELFRLVKGGYDTIQTLYENPGAVSDYALAVAFAKIVDPGSVAREGEVRAVQNAGSMFPAFKQALESMLDVTGQTGRLSPVMRREIANLASQMYNTKAQDAQKSILNYERLAKKAGLKLEDIYVGNPNIEMGIERPKPNTSKDINQGNVPNLDSIDQSEKEKFLAEFEKIYPNLDKTSDNYKEYLKMEWEQWWKFSSDEERKRAMEGSQ